jgi:hypothetical protein
MNVGIGRGEAAAGNLAADDIGASEREVTAGTPAEDDGDASQPAE